MRILISAELMRAAVISTAVVMTAMCAGAQTSTQAQPGSNASQGTRQSPATQQSPTMQQGPAKNLVPAPVTDVTVTAYRIATPVEATASSVSVLSQKKLDSIASPALDDKLSQVEGVQLYRRTSSLVANPTTQGISLRGLGSTAASRTLVLSDGVPVLDPFAGHIHWTEFPPLSVRQVEMVRGAASDLYGSNALSGVIHILRPEPDGREFEAESSGGSEGMREASVLGMDTRGKLGALMGAHWLIDDGYILTAPAFRGPIDQPSNLHSEFAQTELRYRQSATQMMFVRGTVMNEARGNGTDLQNNATRLWRYAGGDDFQAAGTWQLRLFGSDEGYRQTFSSINTARTVENLTRRERTPAEELGGSLLWTHAMGQHGVMLAGSDVHDVRATDLETAISGGAPTGYTDTTARQRQVGYFVEALYNKGAWTGSASVRGDHATTFDGDEIAGGSQVAAGQYPVTTQDVGDPKVGLVRRIGTHVELSASAGRGFRVPTLNELYRTGQVGSIVTNPNPKLQPERATDGEVGASLNGMKWNSSLHGSYFWIEVNRPIVAVTQTATVDLRENLGQIRSRGVQVEWTAEPTKWMQVNGGYQFANATVTRGPIDVGNWIPEVAHNMATAQVDLHRAGWGALQATGRVSGHMYDDDVNVYRLSGYFELDLQYTRAIGQRVQLNAGLVNALDRAIQAGRTPVLTLAQPITFVAGMQWKIRGKNE